jgi:hypothetical protein
MVMRAPSLAARSSLENSRLALAAGTLIEAAAISLL